MQLSLFLLLLAFLPIKLSAFEAHVWQKANGKVASELLISENELFTFSKLGKCYANVHVQIEFRRKNGQIAFSSALEKKYTLKNLETYILKDERELDIPFGEYEVWISWFQGNDPMKTFHTSLSVRNDHSAFFFGDLLLFSKQQKIAPQAVAKGKDIEVITAFKSNAGKNIRLQSSLLYQMRESPGKLTRAYITQQQKNQILTIPAGIYEGKIQFNLEGLASGNYLVDISIFEENQMIAEKTQGFTLTWSGLDSVFSQLDSSILQMEYICSQTIINKLLKISDPELKLNEFKKFWKMQNISPADHETLAMENYYKLIYQANRKYKMGWKSEEGKRLVLYASPSQ